MPAAIREFYRSPSATLSTTDPRYSVAYRVTGTDSADDAMTLLVATAPPSTAIGGMVLAKVQYDIEVEDHLVWTCTASYSKKTREERPPLDEFQSQYSFETGGGTVHVKRSPRTAGVYVAAGTPPDFRGAIGWDGNDIAGVDVVSPVFNWSETHCLPPEIVTPAYRLALYRATGKMNDAPFKGLAAGEALFLGASGTARGDGNWEISYRFAGSENAFGMVIDDITVTEKLGWHYLWVYYEPAEDASILIRKPRAVFVEELYKPWDFSTIGIGV